MLEHDHNSNPQSQQQEQKKFIHSKTYNKDSKIKWIMSNMKSRDLKSFIFKVLNVPVKCVRNEI